MRPREHIAPKFLERALDRYRMFRPGKAVDLGPFGGPRRFSAPIGVAKFLHTTA